MKNLTITVYGEKEDFLCAGIVERSIAISGFVAVSKKEEGLCISVAIATAPRINPIMGSAAKSFFINAISQIKKR